MRDNILPFIGPKVVTGLSLTGNESRLLLGTDNMERTGGRTASVAVTAGVFGNPYRRYPASGRASWESCTFALNLDFV